MKHPYPEKLTTYLEEQIVEDNEIITTPTDDGRMFFIPQKGLNGWIVVIEWCFGDDDFQLVNITGTAAVRLRKLMNEENMK